MYETLHRAKTRVPTLAWCSRARLGLKPTSKRKKLAPQQREVLDSGSVWARTLRCVPSKIFPRRRRGLAVLLWELPCTTTSFSMHKRKSQQSPFMVGKSQTSFIYRGNTEHRGRSHGICKMGPENRAFSSAFWSLGARGDRP